ncbi:MAG: iron-containing alcohol dehydrogenase, partial [Alphaproteobacteria bacterium]
MQLAGVFDTIAIERVVFGRPCPEALPEEADRIGAKRLFLIVSKTLDEETDQIDLIRQSLGARYAGSFSGIPSHTPRDAIIEAASAARSANADLIVTYGGGSVTDAGKMVQLCLQHSITSPDQLDAYRETIQADGTRVAPTYEGPKVRQIAVPTTLSAGEFGAGAGCTDPKRGVKELFRHRLFVPRVVVLDPQATLRTPEWLWLSTGIRALDHAVETICSQFANPQS